MSTREIHLYSGEVALVDTTDWPTVCGFRWLADRRKHTTYAYAHVRQPDGPWRNLKLHRLIMAAPAGTEVDHRNRNGLDNRRANLRLCTPELNRANSGIRSDNTSGFKGVSRSKTPGRWIAQIRLGGRMTHLGTFDDSWTAAEAYNHVALEQWGEHAALNSKEWSTS